MNALQNRKETYPRKKQPTMATASRVPPQVLDVERTVLGSILIDGNALDSALEVLTDECFYSSAHRHIFICVRELASKNAPVDVITITEELRRKELLEEVGSEAYLAELAENIATSANITYYAKILEGKATLRQLISAAAEITTECFDPDAESKLVLDRAEAKIFHIAEEHLTNTFESLKTLLPKTFEEIEKYGKEGGAQGTQTGFTKLDDMTTGLHGGDLVIVAGRPGMGKTSFCLSIAINTAVRAEKKTCTAIFSLEMSKAQLVQRMLCAEARVDMHRLRSGKLAKRDLNVLGIAAGPLFEAPIFIDDTAGINVLELRAKARRLKKKENLGLIIIDYIQLMTGVEKTENRQQEISTISRSLKSIAKELDVPVIALSQLSRAVEQRGGDHRPQLSDLRESGAIEQDADLVLFVFREHRYKPEDESLRNVAEIIIGKQRNGPIGGVPVSFIPEFANFGNLEETHVEEDGEF